MKKLIEWGLEGPLGSSIDLRMHHPLGTWIYAGKLTVECTSIWVCQMFFSWLNWGYEECHRGKCHSYPTISRIHNSHDLWLLMLSLIICLRSCLSAFSTLFLSYCTLWEKVTMCSTYVRSRELFFITPPAWSKIKVFLVERERIWNL